jgi:hypothetical protein
MRRLQIKPYYAFAVLLLFFNTLNTSGEVQVSAVASSSAPASGEVFQVTVSAGNEVDFYSASAEIVFDSQLLEFVGLGTGSISDQALVLYGDLEAGRIGAAVSRTGPLDVPATGSFMVLSFMVRPYALAGITEIYVNDMLIHDSGGDVLTSTGPLPVSVDIPFSISYISLQMPAITEISEGELFHIEAEVFAAGFIDTNILICQAGVSAVCSDPGEWDEGLWRDMDPVAVDDSFFINYTAEIAYMRSPGEYSIAIRASLDGENFVYGGTGGVWDPDDNPCATLTVLSRPPYRHTLAKWDFDSQTATPSVAVPANRDSEIVISGAGITGFVSGYSGQGLRSTGWNNNDHESYWMIEISTQGFAELEISSRQSGSNTGPRDFRLEYSLDGEDWIMIDGGEIVVANNWTSGVVERLTLPEALEDTGSVSLRWLRSSDISIGEGDIGSTGTSIIDDIVVTGVSQVHSVITVYPGDTNNDGVVNADDVLPLGIWWLGSGPPAAWESIEFAPRSVEQWMPADATYADANGDGVVDHKDLMPVGLHFGKSAGKGANGSNAVSAANTANTANAVSAANTANTANAVNNDESATGPLSSLLIDPNISGHNIKIAVVSEEPVAKRGVAFSLRLQDIDADMWNIVGVDPGFAGDIPGSEIISFSIADGNLFESANVIKGDGQEITGSLLAVFELITGETIDRPIIVNLERLTLSGHSINGISKAAGSLVLYETLDAEGISGRDGQEMPELHNYPNPFNSVTTIAFRMETAGNVRLEITCMQGRVIETVTDSVRSAGLQTISYDGSRLPPGIYLCRMTVTGRMPEVIKLVRIE